MSVRQRLCVAIVVVTILYHIGFVRSSAILRRRLAEGYIYAEKGRVQEAIKVFRDVDRLAFNEEATRAPHGVNAANRMA